MIHAECQNCERSVRLKKINNVEEQKKKVERKTRRNFRVIKREEYDRKNK